MSDFEDEPRPRGNSAINAAKGGAGAILGAFRWIRSSYDAEGRYSKMRIWIIAVVLSDVLITGLVLIGLGGSSLRVAAWYQKAFPSNLVVVRNDSNRELDDVDLELDGRFKTKADRISPGANGFPIDKEFRDETDSPPPASYQPHMLTIRAGEDKAELDLGPPREGP